ncbi:hypothetical protein M427DRAFT_359821 [Gonapodya prolifera JEL478]|uniref:L domain-like protein n=1 Tax=Gonapodya prolifera (strain JEL478) TaxID=1344416 RepID=A0A139ABR4_GONPJ|nr:hypothetical protein M427DRAFT_359821 [Gonapodya prolifera JEL478]|eukprot:KXS13915.1 hypothetical protein M427DRAFT_359821 [Gonapodya prolifera JEL478]
MGAGIRAIVRWATLASLVALITAQGVPFAGTSVASECAIVEKMYDDSNLPLFWTRGSCCIELGNAPSKNMIISCTAEGRITGIELASANLAGSFPSFNSLTQLRYLSLDSNAITGQIPSNAFDGLTFLYHIDIHGNRISGPLPNLSRTPMIELIVYNNFMSGSIDGLIPSTTTLCRLTPENAGLTTCMNIFPSSCGAVPLSCGAPPPPPPPSVVTSGAAAPTPSSIPATSTSAVASDVTSAVPSSIAAPSSTTGSPTLPSLAVTSDTSTTSTTSSPAVASVTGGADAVTAGESQKSAGPSIVAIVGGAKSGMEHVGSGNTKLKGVFT